jgi:hypothetical protein
MKTKGVILLEIAVGLVLFATAGVVGGIAAGANWVAVAVFVVILGFPSIVFFTLAWNKLLRRVTVPTTIAGRGDRGQDDP